MTENNIKKNFNFEIGDQVTILALDGLKGRIKSIWITKHGVQYEVRYFYDATCKEVYFFEDEIKTN
ncbi:MAG: hypothetical protein PHV37_01850 [Candidatus Gastranaerophilales bacterium]|nr:hypothetical protein [Candidatus Gastranaerophilales bacterium]